MPGGPGLPLEVPDFETESQESPLSERALQLVSTEMPVDDEEAATAELVSPQPEVPDFDTESQESPLSKLPLQLASTEMLVDDKAAATAELVSSWQELASTEMPVDDKAAATADLVSPQPEVPDFDTECQESPLSELPLQLASTEMPVKDEEAATAELVSPQPEVPDFDTECQESPLSELPLQLASTEMPVKDEEAATAELVSPQPEVPDFDTECQESPLSELPLQLASTGMPVKDEEAATAELVSPQPEVPGIGDRVSGGVPSKLPSKLAAKMPVDDKAAATAELVSPQPEVPDFETLVRGRLDPTLDECQESPLSEALLQLASTEMPVDDEEAATAELVSPNQSWHPAEMPVKEPKKLSHCRVECLPNQRSRHFDTGVLPGRSPLSQLPLQLASTEMPVDDKEAATAELVSPQPEVPEFHKVLLNQSQKELEKDNDEEEIFEKEQKRLDDTAELQVPTTDKPTVTVNFLKVLLNQSQKELEKDNDEEEIFEKEQKCLDDTAEADQTSSEAEKQPPVPAPEPEEAPPARSQEETEETWEEEDKLDPEEVKADQKYCSKEEQWKPLNPEEKKRYDQEFPLGFQYTFASMQKPEGLPHIDVVLEKVNKMPLRPLDSVRLSSMNCGRGFTPSVANLGLPAQPNRGSTPGPGQQRSQQNFGA
uniref:Uncharacterized protein n=1 Tax=Sphaerodactylus townsendi TaxID=933632 RepID=A0ACB8GEM5_9SAUR